MSVHVAACAAPKLKQGYTRNESGHTALALHTKWIQSLVYPLIWTQVGIMDSSWFQYADPSCTARDLTVEAAQAIGIGKALKSGGPSKGLPFAKLKALLDSRSDRDILDGLRRVIAMIYQNKPCLPYFSSVVKNVANPNIEIKKLVYIYLLQYAESDPDLALLSVNAIQKSLTDTNPQVRALALRTMSGLRVPVISQIVSLAIKRGVSDMSPHVRKAAALAIPKCYSLDPNSLPQLIDYLNTLLGDKQYFVVGPAVQTFLELCPDRIDLVHKHYRSLVRKLVDMDEWSQLATIKLLTHYSRRCFPYKTRKVTRMNKKGFYDDEPDEVEETEKTERVLDPDLESLLKACRNLLSSRSAAVVIAVSTMYFYLGTTEYVESSIGPLIALLRSGPEIEEIALYNIVAIALEQPALFINYASHFLVSSEDSPAIWKLKIEMLTLIFPHAGLNLQSLILSELEHFCHSSTIELVRESVQAIGRCAQTSPESSARCFRVLLNQISSFDNMLVSEVLTVMRHLIQRNPSAHHKTIVRLARNLDQTSSPQARATIVWLVGEFAVLDAQSESTKDSTSQSGIAPDVLRILTKGFASESEEVKAQIVLLAAKCYLLWLQQEQEQPQAQPQAHTEVTPADNSQDTNTSASPGQLDTTHPLFKLWTYILLLARYDTSYDLRDRARLFKNLLADPTSTQLASLLLLAPKPVPHAPSPSESRRGLMLGSTTLLLGRDAVGTLGLEGYEELPAWVAEGEEPDGRLREGEALSTSALEAGQGGKETASSRLDEAVREQGLERMVAAGRGTGTATGMGKAKGAAGKEGGKARTLDDWLAESEEGEDGSTEEDETDSEEYESEEGEDGSEEDEETDDESDDEQPDVAQRKGLISS